MKQFVGAVSAALIAAMGAAQAGPLAPLGAGGASLGAGGASPYQAVSDFDGPYYQDAPAPPPAPIPVPRYGYAPGPDYGYRPPAPVYGPDAYRPEPYRQDSFRQDSYRQDGYRPDDGDAPAYLPVRAVYAIARDNGFSPLGQPRQRGYTYVISALNRDGEDGRLVMDARSGRILRFVPAFQSGGEYEGMRYEGPAQPGQISPRDSLNNLPPPTVIKADPDRLQPMPAR
jgi:hypothetical protein